MGNLEQPLAPLSTGMTARAATPTIRRDAAQVARRRHETWLGLFVGLTSVVAGFFWAGQLGATPDWSSWSDRGAALMIAGGAVVTVLCGVALVVLRRRFAATAHVPPGSGPLIHGMPRGRFVAGAVFYGAVALGGLACGVVLIAHGVTLTRHGVVVGGTVVSATCGYKGNISVEVAYQVAGVDFTVPNLDWSYCVSAGDPVSLLVNSQDPTDASEAFGGRSVDYNYGAIALSIGAWSGWMLTSLLRGRLKDASLTAHDIHAEPSAGDRRDER